MDAFSQWVDSGPDGRIGLQQSFTSPRGVGALPHHGPRSRLPNPHPISPRYGVHNIEDTLNELTRPRQAAADPSLWGRLQRTDESVQAQKVTRPLPREPLPPPSPPYRPRPSRHEPARPPPSSPPPPGPPPPQNTPRDGIHVEGEYVERREKRDAEGEHAVPPLELHPERLGQHFESWMQEYRDAQELSAQGLSPRRGVMSFDRRMELEDERCAGPICGLMTVPTKLEKAAASPRSYGIRSTDITETLGAAGRGVPDGSYPATQGRSPEGRGFAWGGRHVKCLDMHQEGIQLHHIRPSAAPPAYKQYEPNYKAGEIGFGRSIHRSTHVGLEGQGIFDYKFLVPSPRTREVASMYQTADAGGFNLRASDVRFPPRERTRKEGDVPEYDYSQVHTDLHKETWQRGYELQTSANPSATSPPYGPNSKVSYGRRITNVQHPAFKKAAPGIGEWGVFLNP